MLRFQHSEYLLMLAGIPVLVLLFVLLLLWRARIMNMLGEPKATISQIIGRIPGRITLKAILILLALTVGIVGAANLQGGGHPEKVQRKGVDVLIALDVSKSMLAQDLQPNRLTRAKQFIERILDKLHNDRVGLIIFAGRAYLQSPITIDYSSLHMMLQNVRPDLVPTQGTVIGDAIELGMKSFSQQERKYKTMIVLSDGEDHDEKAEAKAKEAAESGVIIHTVGIGSPQGAPLFEEGTNAPKLDESGQQVISKLNEEEMRDLAEKGHGTYIHLGNAEEAASKLADAIDGMEGRSMGTVAYTDFDSYFQYFLLPALLLLVVECLLPGARTAQMWKTV